MKIFPLPFTEIVSLDQIENPTHSTLVYSGQAWPILKKQFGWQPKVELEVCGATLDAWDALLPSVEGEEVVAVGGGLPADAAKYLSLKQGLPMLCIPTSLSVDAFFTWASGIRRGGCVEYIETKVPERVFVDMDVIADAPSYIRAVGITDVLSIATGSWDWKFAEERGMNPKGMIFQPGVYDLAQKILVNALDCALAAGRGDRGGLKTLLDCLMLEVQLCNQVGHARPEEGSEHYFAYAVENETGPGLPHADLLGPGILLAMGWQGQDDTRVLKAMEDAGVVLDRISETAIQKTIPRLGAYCREHNLPFGIAYTIG